MHNFYGPLSDVFSADPHPDRFQSTNGRLLLHRTAVIDTGDRLELADAPLHEVAVAVNLGQGKEAGAKGSKLVAAVAARRADAVALATRGEFTAIELSVPGAVVTGTGAGGIRDVGIELDGTYGWPILPGSSLKGVTREYARRRGEPMTKIFGSEPESDEVVPGQVTFFDALPGPAGVEVVAHVLTPHTQGYRSNTPENGPAVAPGEHINPIPIPFLAVERGSFIAYLAGPEPHLSEAAALLKGAVGDLGVGAKTASGYGYLKAATP
ncbi:type III-B CRISPR module RAMP protein Cmr6 [Nonomuraea sp. NPDC049419]|uniref:type III-B CRISPR module RAMP protein Cmr6 n=1 Tax=Nonomuraea sp. NPDC049419 TaxID=3155772 RepID=UPI00341523A5